MVLKCFCARTFAHNYKVLTSVRVRPVLTESQVTVRARTPAEEVEISTMLPMRFRRFVFCPPPVFRFLNFQNYRYFCFHTLARRRGWGLIVGMTKPNFRNSSPYLQFFSIPSGNRRTNRAYIIKIEIMNFKIFF